MNKQLYSKYRFLCFSLIALMLHCSLVSAQNLQKIEVDKFPLEAIEIGEGNYGVVLVHGAAVNADYFFGKYSSQFGQKLVSKGFRVIGIKWNHPDSAFGMKSIEAAINRLKSQGVEKISLIGHSRGGELIANFYRQNSNTINIDSIIQIDSVDDQALTHSAVKNFLFIVKILVIQDGSLALSKNRLTQKSRSSYQDLTTMSQKSLNDNQIC